MGKYNWTIDTLINKLKLIERLIRTEDDNERLYLLQSDYYNLQGCIEEFFDNDIEDTPKLLECFSEVRRKITPLKFLWDDIEKFSTVTNKFIDVPRLPTCYLQKNELLDITHDFYKSLNDFFFGNFMKNFYRRYDHITFYPYDTNSEYIGETIFLPSLKESFIKVFRSFTIDDALTTIHEYGHATTVSINPRHLITPNKTLYTEIDTIFMEFIAADYIDKTMNLQISSLHKSHEINKTSCNAETLLAHIDLIKAEPLTKGGYQNNKMLKHIALNQCDIEPDELEELLHNPDINSSIYLTSFMFALELYKIYLEDKEKALYILKQIILLDNLTKEQYYNNIRRFGLIPNQSLQEFYNNCNENVLKLTRKNQSFRK